MDALLQRVWLRYFEANASDLALVAVGGYGRGELHPGSDVDIMILLGDEALDDRRSGLESFLTFLWDIGLEVGHSVRTVEDCAREGAADITVATRYHGGHEPDGSPVTDRLAGVVRADACGDRSRSHLAGRCFFRNQATGTLRALP